MTLKVHLITASGVELNEENGYLLPYNEKTEKYYDHMVESAKEKL